MKTSGKNFLVVFALLILFANSSIYSQNTRIGAISAVPNASAMLDIDGITGLAQAKGALLPRITQVQRLAMNPLPAVAQGLLVYQTNTVGGSLEGFYYNISTTVVPNWVYLVNEKAGWLTTGNAGTIAGTNFIGTIDANDFVTKTGGVAATNERLRVLKTGQIVANNIGFQAGDVFSVYSDATTNGTNPNTSALGAFAINGYSSGVGAGIYGENTGTGYGVYGSSTGYGVFGTTNNNGTLPGVYGENYNLAPALPINTSAFGIFGYTNRLPSGTGVVRGIIGLIDPTILTGSCMGVQGQTSNPTGIGVFGLNNGTSGNSVGVQGQSSSLNGIAVIGITNTGNVNPTTTAYGLYGQANGPAAITGTLIGVRGSTLAATITGPAIGVYGSSSSSGGFGMQAYNANSSGTGIITSGNNIAGTYLIAGSGCAVAGTGVAGFLKATTLASGIGVLGVGNNAGNIAPASGAGVVGSGLQYGVMGFASNAVVTNPLNNSASNGVNGAAGGYFEVQNAGTAVSWAYVGVREVAGALGLRKIIGNGTVNTIVKDLDGKLVSLSCPETPENLFQDYGTGQLINGKTHIVLDPVFSKNITVNEHHPLRIFIQLRDDCNGVFVHHEDGSGFDVTELKGGNSNAKFFWSVSANRADEILSDGTTASYTKERFSPAPGPVIDKRNMEEGRTADQNELMLNGEQRITPAQEAKPETISKKRIQK